jgi:hypothetical protein
MGRSGGCGRLEGGQGNYRCEYDHGVGLAHTVIELHELIRVAIS